MGHKGTLTAILKMREPTELTESRKEGRSWKRGRREEFKEQGVEGRGVESEGETQEGGGGGKVDTAGACCPMSLISVLNS